MLTALSFYRVQLYVVLERIAEIIDVMQVLSFQVSIRKWISSKTELQNFEVLSDRQNDQCCKESTTMSATYHQALARWLLLLAVAGTPPVQLLPVMQSCQTCISASTRSTDTFFASPGQCLSAQRIFYTGTVSNLDSFDMFIHTYHCTIYHCTKYDSEHTHTTQCHTWSCLNRLARSPLCLNNFVIQSWHLHSPQQVLQKFYLASAIGRLGSAPRHTQCCHRHPQLMLPVGCPSCQTGLSRHAHQWGGSPEWSPH